MAGYLGSHRSARTRRARFRSFFRRGGATPYLFILPFGIALLVFFLCPIGYALYESLFRLKRSGLGLSAPSITFNGLGNYADALTDSTFYQSIGRMLLLGVVQIPIMLFFALVLALLLDSAMVRFREFFRLAPFVPYAIPGIVAALLWGFLYDPQISPIVKGLHALGLGAPDFLGAGTVMWSIANILTWESTGYNMLILFAALQAIPSELFDAGYLDGCGNIGIAYYIKIPFIAPALVLTCVFSIIGALQLFNEPQVLTQISNNISSAYTPNIYAYTTAFSDQNYEYAAALAVVLAVVSFVCSFGFLRLVHRYAGV